MSDDAPLRRSQLVVTRRGDVRLRRPPTSTLGAGVSYLGLAVVLAVVASVLRADGSLLWIPSSVLAVPVAITGLLTLATAREYVPRVRLAGVLSAVAGHEVELSARDVHELMSTMPVQMMIVLPWVHDDLPQVHRDGGEAGYVDVPVRAARQIVQALARHTDRA